MPTPDLPPEMFALTTPCRDCPFRRKGGVRHSLRMMSGYIGHFLGWPGATFPCHRSVPNDDPRTDWSTWREGQAICAGGLIFAERHGVENAVMQLARHQGVYEPAKLTGTDLVFDGISAMLATATDASTCTPQAATDAAALVDPSAPPLEISSLD